MSDGEIGHGNQPFLQRPLVVIAKAATVAPSPVPVAAARNIVVFSNIGCDGASARQVVTVKRGEPFTGPRNLEIATVESGSIILEVTTASGLEFCLRRLDPGDVVVPLDPISNPAFSLTYRSDETARVSWLRSRTSTPNRAVEAERMLLRATTDLLGACIRMIHELASLPSAHRLYCELLRIATRNGPGRQLTAFDLPTHATLAARLCTTRETISRELSFLRRNKVLSNGKPTHILDAKFLLNRIAGALNLEELDDVWAAIGVRPD